MKKPSSLAQQVQEAQRAFNSWTEADKSSVRLEGSSGILNRFLPSQPIKANLKALGNK